MNGAKALGGKCSQVEKSTRRKSDGPMRRPNWCKDVSSHEIGYNIEKYKYI